MSKRILHIFPKKTNFVNDDISSPEPKSPINNDYNRKSRARAVSRDNSYNEQNLKRYRDDTFWGMTYGKRKMR